MEKSAQEVRHLKWIQQESKENYLKAIYMLGLQRISNVRYADLEKYFGFSKASVCKAVRALNDEGFIIIDKIGKTYCVRLTEQGQNIAQKTYEKFCFFREILIRAGVEPKQAEAEACKLEHGISYGSLSNLITVYAVSGK